MNHLEEIFLCLHEIGSALEDLEFVPFLWRLFLDHFSLGRLANILALISPEDKFSL
jgi:hypothetical protein